MPRVMEWLRRCTYLFRRSRLDRQLHEEAHLHLEMRSAELESSGTPRADALAQASREFGSLLRMQEDSRKAWQFIWWEQWLADIRYACRSLSRDPAATLVVFSTLVLGTAINTAVFTVTNSVVFQALPYPQPDQVVIVWQTDRRSGSRFVVSAANYFDLKSHSNSFQELAAVRAFQDRDFNLGLPDGSVHVSGVKVAAELFPLLGIKPLLGRALHPGENQPGHDGAALLSEQLWRSAFGSDPSVLGKTILLNGAPVMVVGVMPATFQIPLIKAQVYLPVAWTQKERQERPISNYIVIGRLRNASGLKQANAATESIAVALERQYPEVNKDAGLSIQSAKDAIEGSISPTLMAIFAASIFLLLASCISAANLLMARLARRKGELAVRAALGANPFRIAREIAL